MLGVTPLHFQTVHILFQSQNLFLLDSSFHHSHSFVYISIERLNLSLFCQNYHGSLTIHLYLINTDYNFLPLAKYKCCMCRRACCNCPVLNLNQCWTLSVGTSESDVPPPFNSGLWQVSALSIPITDSDFATVASTANNHLWDNHCSRSEERTAYMMKTAHDLLT